MKKNASVVMKTYEQKSVANSATKEKITLKIASYEGRNPFVLAMMKELQSLRKYLHSAFLHGSLATGEQIPYSDFDALVIIRSEVFKKKNDLVFIAKELNRLRKYMNQLDPLQHHGWFVLSENDLVAYPEDYLPVEVLQYGSSMFEDQEITILVSERADFKTRFFSLCESLQRKISGNILSAELFGIKSFFSEFMMLPALYVETRDNKGVFKRYSFDAMRPDFHPNVFAPMDVVSSIRQNWELKLTEHEKNYLARTDYASWQKRKKISYTIPENLKKIYTQSLLISMSLLIESAKNKIQQKIES